MNKVLSFFIVAFIIVGCGYKPASYYTKEVLSGGIYVEVEPLASDPENTVLIHDSINEAVVVRFKGALASKREAATYIKAKIGKIAFETIQKDEKGYAIMYRTTVTLNYSVVKNGMSQSFTTSGFYDFAIEPNSIISDSKRFESIKVASTKALDEFVSRLGIAGWKR